jgi:exopolysaccharide production protein ExoQ
MTIPRNVIQFAADTYTVLVLVLSTDAFLPLLINGNDPTDVSQGAPLMKAAWALVYAITIVRLIRRQTQVFPLIRANKPLVSLVLLTFVSVFWSVDRGATLHAAMILSLSALFALDLSVRYTFARQIRLICIALALVIGMSVLVELLLPGFVPGNGFQGSAWHGVFGTKNEFGRIITLGVAACLALPRQPRWSKAVGAIATGGVLAVLAQSAGAVCYVAAIAGFFMLFSVLKWRPKQRKIAIVASTIAVLLMVCFVAQNFAKVTVLIGKDPSLSRRTGLWKMSLADIQENPLLGYGYSAFWSKTSRPANLIREEVWKDAPHSHNGYIELALGLGLVGLGAYSLVFVTMAQRSYLFYMNGQRSGEKWPLIYLVFISIFQFTESGIVSGDTIVWIVFCCLAFSLPQVGYERVALPSIARHGFAS